jgi:hypothetical protein
MKQARVQSLATPAPARSPRFARARGLAAALSLGLLIGCAEPATSINADPARRAAPLAACVMRLPARKQSGFMRQLSDEQYWKLVFPDYDASTSTLPEDAVACTGATVWDHAVFEKATLVRSPLRTESGDILFGGGANRIKVLWLKTHELSNGEFAGPLAIVRNREDYAEAYAIGVYRGHGKKTRFGLERMGSQLLVTALDDRCAGRRPDEPCDTTLVVYLPWRGTLEEFASIPLERVRFTANLEPGVQGQVEYALVTSPSYEPGGIRLFEQITATDGEGRAVRKAEKARSLSWRSGRVIASDDSLWDLVYVSQAPEADAKAVKP